MATAFERWEQTLAELAKNKAKPEDVEKARIALRQKVIEKARQEDPDNSGMALALSRFDNGTRAQSYRSGLVKEPDVLTEDERSGVDHPVLGGIKQAAKELVATQAQGWQRIAGSALRLANDFGENEKGTWLDRAATSMEDAQKSTDEFAGEGYATADGIRGFGKMGLQNAPILISTYLTGGAAAGATSLAGRAAGLAKTAQGAAKVANAARWAGAGGAAAAGFSGEYGDARQQTLDKFKSITPEQMRESEKYAARFKAREKELYLAGATPDDAAKQAYEETVDALSETDANIVGVVNSLIEFAAPGASKFFLGGGKLSSKSLANAKKFVNLDDVKDVSKQFGQEFLQEGFTSAVTDDTRAKAMNEDVNWGQVGKDALVGGTLGAIMGGGAQFSTGQSTRQRALAEVKAQEEQQQELDAQLGQAAQARKAELDAIRQQRPLTPEEQDDADVADAIISRGAPQGQPVQEAQPAAPVGTNTPPPVEQPPAQPAPGLSGVVQRHTQSAAPSLDAAFSDAIKTGQSPDFSGLAQQTGIDRNSLVDQFNAKRTEHVRKQGLMDLAEQGDLNALRSAVSGITVDPQQQDQLIEEAVAGNEQRKAEALAASQQQGLQAQQQAQQAAQQQAEKDKYDQTYSKMLDEAVAALEGGQTEVKTFLPIKKKYSASGLNATDVNGVIDHAKQVIAEKQQKAARHEQAVTEAMPHLQSGDEASAVLAMEKAGVTDDADVQSVLKEANKRIRQDSKKPAGAQSVPVVQPADQLASAVAEVKAAQAAGKKVNLATIAKKHGVTIMDVAKGVAAKPEQAAPKAKPSQPLALPAPQGPATTGEVMVSRNGKVMSQAEADTLDSVANAEKKQMRRDMAEEAGNPTGIPTGMKPKVEKPARTEQKAVLPNLILRTDGKPFPDTKQATRVLASKKLEDTHEVVSVEGGKAIAPKKQTAKNQVDPEKDDILTAIAKLGGIDRAQAKSQGIDPADFSRRAGGIQFVFRKNGGKELDRMAEALSEMGYPVTENGDYTVNALLDSLDAALRGSAVGTPIFHEARARAEYEARYEEEMAQAAINDTWDSPGSSSEPDWMMSGTDDAMSSILDDDITPAPVIASELEGIENERRDNGQTEGSGQEVDTRAADSGAATGAESVAGRRSGGQQEGQGGAGQDSGIQAGFSLTAQTEAERLAEEQRQAADLEAKRQADEAVRLKAQADKDREGFTLTGSNRPADVAMAAGQNDLFAPKTRGHKEAEKNLPKTEDTISDADYAQVVEAAKYLKDIVYSLDNLLGDDKRLLLSLSSPLGKSGRDTILMDTFGIDRNLAHTIHNRMDDSKPHKLRDIDMTDALDTFPMLKKIIDDVKEELRLRDERKAAKDIFAPQTRGEKAAKNTAVAVYAPGVIKTIISARNGGRIIGIVSDPHNGTMEDMIRVAKEQRRQALMDHQDAGEGASVTFAEESGSPKWRVSTGSNTITELGKDEASIISAEISNRDTGDKIESTVNSVMTEVRSMGGDIIGVITDPYSGNKDDIMGIAQSQRSRMFDRYPDASNMQSTTIATDGSGRPAWRVSPNMSGIEQIGQQTKNVKPEVAAIEASPRQGGAARITPEAAGDMKAGDIIRTPDGREYVAMRARHDFMDAHPIIDGKPVVNRDSAVRFHLNPNTESAYPDRNHAPIYKTGRNQYEEPVREMAEDGRAKDGKPIIGGDKFKTSSGRETTPYPHQKSEKYASQWLIDNATAEAEARGDDFNAPIFRRTTLRKNGTLTDADRESMLMYLFGEQPAVPPSILKPLIDEGAQTPTNETITDFGEKIGGARKDTAGKSGAKPRPGKTDDRPAWARRFEVSQIADVSGVPDAGKWVIRDNRNLDWKKQPRQVGRLHDTREAAEAEIPLIAVAMKHRAIPLRDGKYEIWREVSDRKRVKVVDQVFDSRDEAMRYMAQHAIEIIETNTTFGEADLPRPDSTARIGKDRRKGNVRDSDFVSVFGFRGVEFGNWNNQGERQDLLNDAYDALLDLAEVMGIPPKGISLNGELALAFGARGQGLSGARAHYERNKAVINLTKMNGAGTLAHEWFHALDHYFGRQDGKSPAEWVTDKDGTRSLKTSGSPEGDYASGGLRGERSGMRAELQKAYRDVMVTMTKKAESYIEDTAKADGFVGRARDDVREKLDDIRKHLADQLDARYYKRMNKPASAEQLAEFDAIAERIVAGESLETSLSAPKDGTVVKRGRLSLSGMRWTNEALERISAIMKDVRGRQGFTADQSGPLDELRRRMTLYSTRLKMLADAQSSTEKMRAVPTEYAMDAKELDQGRGQDYWTTPHEMAARAFQGYVEDKIASRGGKSQFLNYAPENVAIETPWGWKRPYPHGEERKAINAAFDRLVDTIQTEDTESGVRLYSTAPSSPAISVAGVSETGKYIVSAEGQNERDTSNVQSRKRAYGSHSAAAHDDLFAASAVPASESEAERNRTDFSEHFSTVSENLEQGRVKSPERITGHEEAAALFARWKDFSQERFLVAGLDANNKVVEVAVHTVGLKASASVDPGTVAGMAARNPAIKSVWLAHNHPSGSSAKSAADAHITRAIGDLISAAGISIDGHIILGADSYTVLDSEGEALSRVPGLDEFDYQNIPATTSVPLVDRMITKRDPGTKITGPDSAKKYVVDKGASGIVLMDTQLNVVGFWEMTLEQMGQMRQNQDSTRSLMAAIDASNAFNAIVSVPDEMADGGVVWKNVAAMLAASQISVVDAIGYKAGKSYASLGLQVDQKGRNFYSAVAGTLSTGLTTSRASEILSADPVLSKALPFIELKQATENIPAGAEPIGAEGYYHNGKITLFPDNIKATPTQTAEERLKWVAFHEVTHRGVANLAESREYMAELQQAGKNPFIKNLAKRIHAKRQGTPYEVSMEVAIEEALAEVWAALQTGSSKTIKAQYGLHFPLSIRPRAKSAVARFFEAVKRIYSKLTGRGLTNEQVGDLLRKTHEVGIGPGDGPKGGKKFSASSKTINIDGKDRPTTNSTGKTIATTEAGIRNFWKWFGDSKVVDAEGRPLVVYHGTRADFSEFSRDFDGDGMSGEARSGFFFTSDPSEASGYASGSAPGGRVMPAYVAIKRPSIFEFADHGISDVIESDTSVAAMLRKSQSMLARLKGTNGLILKNIGDDNGKHLVVAFSPDQIKSATGNNGDFSADTADIRYSAPPTPGQPPSRSVFASVAKQWMFQKWTETLGTQLNTAMLEPLFKPTYQLVQRYLQHTSNDAYDAISVAPNLLGRLEDVNDYKREIKNIGKFRKINADREAAAVPLFEGTRFDKKVYSDAVLKRVYNLTDDQVAVYREARAAIEASLDSHAKSVITKILLDAGAVEFSDIDTLVNRDLPADDYMEDLRQRLDADILAANDAIAIQKTALSAAGVTAQDKASIQASIKKGSRRVELLEEAAKRIDSTEDTLSQLKREGYFPLMRWGKYTVTAKDAGGNVVDFRMVETLREKAALSEALTKQYQGQGMTVTSGTMDEGRFKDFRGMSPETLALFAKELGVDNDEAYQEYLKLALPGQSALKRRIHRKGDNGEGIAGFSMDIQRTLASFVMGNARHSARNIYGSAITKSVDAIPGERGDVRGLARNLAEFVTQPDENGTSVSIRNMLFVWNMGASVAFGALNLSQPWMMTLPWLSQFSGAGNVASIMGKASKTAAIAQKNGTVPQEYYAEYQQAVREGHVDPQNVFMLQGIERGGSGLGSSLLKTISHGMGMIAAATESYNRKLTLFAALDVARAKGLPWLKSKGFDSAYAFAVQAVAETQGVYNKGNRPTWARGPIGAVLLVFKQYAVNWIEMAVRMGRNHYGEDRMRKGLMMMLGLLFAMAGAMGMPGAEDLKDIAETAMGSVGKPVNIERQMQMTLGKGMADAVMAGPMNALVLNSIGLDMHGRMSMGNIIPGTGAFNPYTSTDAKLSEGISVMGAGTGLLKKGSDAVAAAQDGRFLDAAQSAAPRAVESIMKGVRMMAEGKARDSRGNVLMETTPAQAVSKMLDFQPASVAITQRERGRRFQDKNIQMVARTSLRNRLITAYEEKDAEKIRGAEQALDEWNQDNPLYQIKLKKRDLRRAAKKRGASWLKREETPKGLEWMDEYADQENGQ